MSLILCIMSVLPLNSLHSNIAVCSSSIPSVAGIIIGGHMLKRLKMTLTGAIKFSIAVTILGLLGTVTLMFFSCPPNILPPMEPSGTYRYVYILLREKHPKHDIQFVNRPIWRLFTTEYFKRILVSSLSITVQMCIHVYMAS